MTALYKLQGITKDFTSGSVNFQALRGVDLAIEEGEVVGLCGPSGSGKSTLLNILGLIEEPTGGDLAFAGRSIVDMNEAMLTQVRRKAVGFIFQNFNLIPILSALENVEYSLYLDKGLGRDEIRERSMKCLEVLGLSKYSHHKPSELSGGQRQRVAIARAIVKNPSVVVADEPTANLDSKTAGQIIDLIGHLNDAFGTTVLVATHDPHVAKACGKVVNIRDGQVQSIH